MYTIILKNYKINTFIIKSWSTLTINKYTHAWNIAQSTVAWPEKYHRQHEYGTFVISIYSTFLYILPMRNASKQFSNHTYSHECSHLKSFNTVILHTLYFFTIPLHLCRTTSVGLTLPLRWWMKSTSLTEGEYGRPENNVNPAFPVCREQNGSWSHTDLLLGRCTDNIHFNFSPEGKFSRGSYWRQAGDVTAIFHQLTAWYQHNNLFLLIWGQFGFVLLYHWGLSLHFPRQWLFRHPKLHCMETSMT